MTKKNVSWCVIKNAVEHYNNESHRTIQVRSCTTLTTTPFSTPSRQSASLTRGPRPSCEPYRACWSSAPSWSTSPRTLARWSTSPSWSTSPKCWRSACWTEMAWGQVVNYVELPNLWDFLSHWKRGFKIVSFLMFTRLYAVHYTNFVKLNKMLKARLKQNTAMTNKPCTMCNGLQMSQPEPFPRLLAVALHILVL